MGRHWSTWASEPFFGISKNDIAMNRKNAVACIEFLLKTDRATAEAIANDNDDPNLIWVLANTLLREGQIGKPRYTWRMLEAVIGKEPTKLEISDTVQHKEIVCFEEFVYNAGYPEPFEKQIQMREFANGPGARLLLGARNYGKTDYVTILNSGYELYADYMTGNPTLTYLLVTKSDSRNASIISEIGRALECNGVVKVKQNLSCVRVKGLIGKDHSFDALTLGSTAFRGRHPRRVIMDDPITEDDDSEATRKRAQKKYNELSKLTPNVLVIGQPVHKFDLYETLRPMLTKMEVPYGSIPELDVDLDAQRLAGVSEESIQASYFLNVVSEAGNPLEKVKFLDEFPAASSVAFIDPSFEGGDYTAMSVVTQHFDGVAVFGKAWKRAWYDCVDEMQAVISKYQVGRLCFETNSLGEQPIILLRDLIEGCGIVGRKTTGNKHARIASLGPYAENIHIAKNSDRIYIDQVKKYEYGSKYDDSPDSLASCLQWIGLIRGVR